MSAENVFDEEIFLKFNGSDFFLLGLTIGSLFERFTPNFLLLNDDAFSKLPPCLLIEKSIRDYKNRVFFEPRSTNSIELRAVKNTEFRIVNFIMEQCSAYGYTIPRILLHTLSDKGVENVL